MQYCRLRVYYLSQTKFPPRCRSYHWRMRDFWTNFSKDGSRQKIIQEDSDTYDMAFLTVTWRSFALFVVLNFFCCTDSAKYDTSMVFYYCCISSRSFSLMSECARNVHHQYQLTDFLDILALENFLVVSRMLLATISTR